ncbi:MAG: LysM peptidoglycan-binding domain-containing protein [Microbacteriaceae bacterium]
MTSLARDEFRYTPPWRRRAKETGESVQAQSQVQEYRVTDSDTVNAIAERFGISTARILVLNGLSWRSPVVPGQTLVLSPPEADHAPGTDIDRYVIAAGDTISGIATSHGLSTAAVLRANGLSAESIIIPGQVLVLP